MADFVIMPEATQDIDSAVSWYENRQDGLGLDFLDRIEECFERIRTAPRRYPIV